MFNLKKEQKINNYDNSISSSVSNINMIDECEFEEGNLDITEANKLNRIIDFLSELNFSKLRYELYDFMKKQIRVYNKYESFKVLELTKEQLDIFNSRNISIDEFKKEPFTVDAVVVHEEKEIEYKYFDSELELNKFLENYNRKINEDRGLYFLTSYAKGCFGDGLYVCDNNSELSQILFNNCINEKVDFLYRNGNDNLYFACGKYKGMTKRCISGKLEGMIVLLDNLDRKPKLYTENISLYGEYEDILTLTKDEEMDLKLQENLGEVGIGLSFVDSERAMG